MLSDIPAFRIAGNLYFVGNYAVSAHLIDTGDGLILIDCGYDKTVETIVEGITSLGFSVSDLRIILLSHGHGDHTGGAPRLKALSGAETYMNLADTQYGFTPDHDLRGGDVIRLGNTAISVVATPGHTVGTVSFFWDIEHEGRVYRAGMFGGAGTKQVRWEFLHRFGLSTFQRGDFFRSLALLRREHVDIFVGNHSWHNQTREGRELLLSGAPNPFIDDTRWGTFLDKTQLDLEAVIEEERHTLFVNYAHRGASEYAPENTLMSFNLGLFLNANGIETDVHRTKDGVLVLFHDNSLKRVTGHEGAIEDYTYEELLSIHVLKNGLSDRIVTLDDFLRLFAWRDITLAIELKGAGLESDVAALIHKYNCVNKVCITSFNLDWLAQMRRVAPELRCGYLTDDVSDEVLDRLVSLGIDEICPRAALVTPESVDRWQRLGFNVRAWGVSSDELMRAVVDSGANGMTVNFPDRLERYWKEREQSLKGVNHHADA